jgi:hypothetical protein
VTIDFRQLAARALGLYLATLVFMVVVVVPLAGSLRHVFDASSWPRRGSCGYWSSVHASMLVTFDVTIYVAYFAIPALMIWRWVRWERYGESPAMLFLGLVLFAAFIASCGVTHLVGDVMPFLWPAYWVVTIFSGACALVSVAAMVYLRLSPGMIGKKRSSRWR